MVVKLAKVFKLTFLEFVEDDPMGYCASIAFYTIFSLPAILLIATSIASSFYDQQAVDGGLLLHVQKLWGKETAEQIVKILENLSTPDSKFFARLIGIITLVFSATTVFISLQSGLNWIWGIKPKPQKGFLKFIINRLLSLAMIISTGFLLIVSLITDAIITVFNEFVTILLTDAALYIAWILNITVSLGIVTLIFGLIFKVLPDAHIKWRDVWVGAFVTALLFALGKLLIGLYLSSSSLGTTYGAAGSLVLILIWVYYSSVILLFGAEFTYVYSREIGDRIRPYKEAVIIKVYEVEQEDGIVNT